MPLDNVDERVAQALVPGGRTIAADPYPWPFDGDLRPGNTALVVIDMQVDFCAPGGYVDVMGYDIALTRAPIEPIGRVLAAFRQKGFHIIHTREGHRPDLTDLPPAKKIRGKGAKTIGDDGPMGRILIRGEAGHDIIPELRPAPDEPIIDKPGKGAFHATDLHAILQARGIRQLVVTGVTTEVCVNTTVREANDRGYDCLVVAECCGSYFPEFHEAGLRMIAAQGGIFGWVGHLEDLLPALSQLHAPEVQTATGDPP